LIGGSRANARMLPRCLGVLAALLALLIGAPASKQIDAPTRAIVHTATAPAAISAGALPHREFSHAGLCQRIDGDDTPDPPVPAGAPVHRSEPVAHRAAVPPVDPVRAPAVRAASARGPPTV
jgi:hypothetical protein